MTDGMRLRAVSAFAGAGGMDLGVERAGFEVEWAGEKDRHACATLRAAWPGRHVAEGVMTAETVAADDVLGGLEGKVDLVCGGPPCQPFSAAGKGGGERDERDGWPVFLALAGRVGARAFVGENVEGLTDEVHGGYLRRVVLKARERGYGVMWKVLDAADYGVGQHRRRVFVVGFREAGAAGRFRWPEGEWGPGRGKAWRTAGEVLAAVGDAEAGDPGLKVTETQAERMEAAGIAGPVDLGRPSRTVTARNADAGARTNDVLRVRIGGGGPRGQQRCLTLREAAGLQGFPGVGDAGWPEGWPFCGPKGAVARQVGNACPPGLAGAVAGAVREALCGVERRCDGELALRYGT